MIRNEFKVLQHIFYERKIEKDALFKRRKPLLDFIFFDWATKKNIGMLTA